MAEFSTAGFAAHLAEMIIEIEHETHAGLEEAARIVEREAKESIGDYQDDSGPFAGWAELADATKADRVRQGYSENDPGLRSGEMRDSIEHVVNGHTAHVGSNDDKLVFFELGTSKQPPRSVLGGAVYRKEHKVVDVLGRHFMTALVGQGVVDGSLTIRASAAADLVKDEGSE